MKKLKFDDLITDFTVIDNATAQNISGGYGYWHAYTNCLNWVNYDSFLDVVTNYETTQNIDSEVASFYSATYVSSTSDVLTALGNGQKIITDSLGDDAHSILIIGYTAGDYYNPTGSFSCYDPTANQYFSINENELTLSDAAQAVTGPGWTH